MAYQHIPMRHTGVRFMLDANAINARQGNADLNQLELWHDNDVVTLLMPTEAYQEAAAGNDTRRSAKVSQRIAGNSGIITEDQRNLRAKIEEILFPGGAKDQGQINDAEIVYEALAWSHILVTTDGGSKRQPRGILGSREELAGLGIRVMRPQEAVEYARVKVRERDERETRVCQALGVPLPEWLGRD